MKKQNENKRTGVLLVNPPSPDDSIIIRDLNRSGRTSKEKIIWPQTNLAYLAAMVPENLSVKIIDCIAEKMDWNDFIDVLEKEKPRYLLSHVITSVANNDFKTFFHAKKVAKSKTISIGPHVTELTKETLKEQPSLDFIIRGEGEITFRELIDALENKKSLSKVRGLAYKKGKKIFINKPRGFVSNLDKLPIPRHDLLPIDKYVFPFIASKFTFVVSSRGCPYPCIFCRQPIMWAKKVRTRSAENIMKELRMLKEIGVKSFLFHSDTFTIKKEIVIKLCKLMVKEKLNMKWGCNSRVDTIDKEMLYWMKKAGCWMIAYGIESGSDEILRKNKKEATVKQAIDAVNWANLLGIKVYGYFIIGMLGETKETIKQTIRLAKKLPITFAIFHVASPYPGTEFYKVCKKKGFLDNEEWEDINQGGTSPVKYPEISGEEIMKWVRRAYLSFYLRPRAILKLMMQIKNFRDLKHLTNMAIEHLKW